MSDITILGQTNWRNENKYFGIKDSDRFGHIYCIGKTGVGKSTLLLNMAISDIERGNGLCVIDPHGDVSELLLHYIPASRIEDVVYFNPADVEYPIGFNPLKDIDLHQRHLVASGLTATFKKIWADSWGPRLEYILRYCILTLLEYPYATLLDIQPLLTDQFFREQVLEYVEDSAVRAFWFGEFDKYSPQLRSEAISPILNKAGVFHSSIPLRNCLDQQKGEINLELILNSKKILICNLAKGTIGEDASTLLGSILVTGLQLGALKRAAIPEAKRIPFYVYVDEMHSFVSLAFADMLAEARKYKLSLFLTHQYIEQLHEKIRSAIFGNVGTLISFRVGAVDATYLAKEFQPIFSETDLVTLPKYTMYIKLLIDGATSIPFSARTILQKKIIFSDKGYNVKSKTEKSDREQNLKIPLNNTLFD